MRSVLRDVERYYEENGFLDRREWRSLYIDYETPVVERLWRPWGDARIYIHRIHPCSLEEAFMHPHPWASAMRILQGEYRMLVGYGPAGGARPESEMYMELQAGVSYEMCSPEWWHAVAPRAPVITLMVTDKPWKSDYVASPVPKQRELSYEEKEALYRDASIAFFNRGR